MATKTTTHVRRPKKDEAFIGLMQAGLMLTDKEKTARQLARYHMREGNLVEVAPPCDGCKKRFVTLASAEALQARLKSRVAAPPASVTCPLETVAAEQPAAEPEPVNDAADEFGPETDAGDIEEFDDLDDLSDSDDEE